MIDQEKNPVEWALLLMEIDEAKEHLGYLIEEMEKSGNIEESGFKVQLFYVITHLNRVWNRRDHIGYISEKELEVFSKVPLEFMQIG